MDWRQTALFLCGAAIPTSLWKTVAASRRGETGPAVGWAIVLASTTGIVGGALAFASWSPPAAAAEPELAFAPAQDLHGMTMNGDLVVVTNPGAFFDYVAISVDLIRKQHPGVALNASDLLVELLANRFPDRAWPPVEGPALQQWDDIVERVAAVLEPATPPPQQRLRVVK